MDADGSDERRSSCRPGTSDIPASRPTGSGSRTCRRARPAWPRSGLPTRTAATRGCSDDSALEDSAPAWSPDGTKLAFESHGPVGGTDGDIYVLDLRSGAVSQLTGDPPAAPVHDEGPAWSPDGTMIAFTSERSDLSGDIWIMQADGSDPRRLTTTPVLDESPDWQPLPFDVGPSHRSAGRAETTRSPPAAWPRSSPSPWGARRRDASLRAGRPATSGSRASVASGRLTPSTRRPSSARRGAAARASPSSGAGRRTARRRASWRGGFEPSKAEPPDLQSGPFDRSGTPPSA